MGAAVDLHPAAKHHGLQRRALGGRAHDGGGGVGGEPPGVRKTDAGVGLPDAEIDEHVRVERGDDLDDAIALRGLEQMELGLAKSPARRVHIDADERADPGFGLELRGHE